MARATFPRHVLAVVGGAAAGLIAIIVLVPLLLADNPEAQIIFGLLLALVTTLISVYATIRYSHFSSQDELTRYGLQAWRNLDSLAIKISRQVSADNPDVATLEEWLLDVDQARWAWRDLLREVFELQARLEAETEEISSRFKKELAETRTAEARTHLYLRHAAEIADRVARAPLPIRIPVDVACPNCGYGVGARLGESAGETGWTTCPNCSSRFAVHRQADGGVKVGEPASKQKVAPACPACDRPIVLFVADDHAVTFVTQCPGCRTHVLFQGSSEDHTLEDLGQTNDSFRCPKCEQVSHVWVTPGREVRFLTKCKECSATVEIVGTVGDVTARMPSAAG